MTPLDLTRRPPRGPRERAAGLVLLPRTIDKARALLPGGNSASYFITPGLSAWLLRKLQIDEAEFVRLVGESDDEAVLSEQLASRINETLREKMNRYVDSVRVGDLSPENQDIVRRNHPWPFADEMLLSEVLEEDDRRLFPLSDTV